MSALTEYREAWPYGEVSFLADAAVDELEAESACQDRMLQLAYEQWELPADWDPEAYAVWLDDLRDRAKEGKE